MPSEPTKALPEVRRPREGDAPRARGRVLRGRVLPWAIVALAAVGATSFIVRALGSPTANGENLFYGRGVYTAIFLLSALACFLRAAKDREKRVAWIAIGLAQCCWTAANLTFSLLYLDNPHPPYPSIADALWLAEYPFYYVGLVGLARARTKSFDFGIVIDAMIGVAALATAYTSLVLTRVIDGAAGFSLPALLTNLAYPVGDFIMLALTISLVAFGARRLTGGLGVAVAAFALFTIGDGICLVQTVEGTYVLGSAPDGAWAAAAVLIALAATLPLGKESDASRLLARRVAVPVVGAIVAIGFLLQETLGERSVVTIMLAGVTLMLVIIRMALDRVQVGRLLNLTEMEARTDALTGLANRRTLLADLDTRLEEGAPAHLALFDLDGFKYYNDTYGHIAGDELLCRIARGLAEESDPATTAYRLGGDEFCLLGDGDGISAEAHIAAVASAVAQRGEGFHVRASFGFVSFPAETADPIEVLRLADRRMYAAKNHTRASAERQSADVLVAVLRAHNPDLGRHGAEVAELALDVGREMGVAGGELDQLKSAAALHDIGKMAIPDAIVNKAGPLDEEEWSFMRRHTLIGERIVGTAPALAHAANIVRASHERWDGGGYPDGIARREIPLESRIIFVCDAFDAMTEERPYRKPMESEAALIELQRCAGSQFDPDVVAGFKRVIAERDAHAPAPAIAA